MPVTLQQVAESSGLSVQTVSYVLNDKAHLFRPETRKRVVDAAKKLGYRPNSSAKAMRRGHFGGISLLLSTDKNRSHLPAGLLEGIQSVLAENDLLLNIACLPDEKLTNEGYVPKILRQLTSDGLLINYTDHIPSRMIDLIKQHQIPSVWLNTRHEEDVVHPDDCDASKRATLDLLQRGHRRIAYVDYHNNHAASRLHYSVTDRHHAYVAAMKEAGLEPRVIWEHRPIAPGERVGLAAQWLRQSDRPTAVVTYSPWTAVPIWLAATAVCGLSVPRDLSIVTFSDVIYEDLGVSIAAMVLPEQKIARAATERLLSKIASPQLHLPPMAIPFHFEPGQTLGPPPS